jgi:hypothetical protein
LNKFVSGREVCDHLRGELSDPSDAERTREIFRSVTKICAGTDAELEVLRSRYANDPAVITMLNRFEDNIE